MWKIKNISSVFRGVREFSLIGAIKIYMIKPIVRIVYDEGVPEFVISNHAYMRIKERVGVSDDKLIKVVLKAWFSKERVSERFMVRRRLRNERVDSDGQTEYRVFNGTVFVFSLKRVNGLYCKQKILVTVYENPKLKNHKRRDRYNPYIAKAQKNTSRALWQNSAEWKKKVKLKK